MRSSEAGCSRLSVFLLECSWFIELETFKSVEFANVSVSCLRSDFFFVFNDSSFESSSFKALSSDLATDLLFN
jgi:hypothetical protein